MSSLLSAPDILKTLRETLKDQPYTENKTSLDLPKRDLKEPVVTDRLESSSPGVCTSITAMEDELGG